MISDAERDVLKMLWEHGPQTAGELRSRLEGVDRHWAPTTVLTLLSRLETKGFVAVDRARSPHQFSAAVSREDLLNQQLTNLADEYCDGSATPLMRALVSGQKLSAEEARLLKELIDELAAPGRKPRRPKNSS